MASTLPLIGPDKASKNYDLALEIFWKVDNVPKNLTGYLISFTIKRNGATSYIGSTNNGKITVPDPTSGKAFLRIPVADLALIPSGTHRYHCTATKDGITEALIEESQIEIA